MPWWAASLFANVAIIWTEYINRHATGGWFTVLPQTAPLIIVAQYCLFYSFNGAPHWLIAWTMFSVGNAIMRASAVGLFGGGVHNWPVVLAAIFIMICGSYVLKLGLKP